ncbi:MAG: peptidylprolyl isomerase [Candidatus Melainabacteria bacterium]|nr:peptidylprolyl isomerase [Candidatus Melainabacteria bacterium]
MKKLILTKSATVALGALIVFTGCSSKPKDPADTKLSASGGNQKTAVDFTSGKISNLEFKSSLIEKIRKENLGEQVVIFKVGNESVNVGDFKNAFKAMQAQMKLLLNQTPGMEERMVEQAKRLNISLTQDEQSKLITMAHQRGGASLEKTLKDQGISVADFDKQVLQMGLALKVITSTVEQSCLNQLITKCLFIDGAYQAGLAKAAYSNYVDYKGTSEYQEILKVTDITPTQLQEQIIKEGLAEAMQDKILSEIKIKDQDVFEFYSQQKDKFKGEGLVRWSQIFFASPKAELKRNPQMIAYIKSADPKMTDAEIAKRLDDGEVIQKKKALFDLRMILSGADFAKLANEDTDDREAKQAKSGGDMGYMSQAELESSEVFAPISKALAAMQPNQVYPQLIETPYGWHIVKLINRPKDAVPFSEIKDGLKASLIAKSKEAIIKQWVAKQQEVKSLEIAKEFSDCLSFSG